MVAQWRVILLIVPLLTLFIVGLITALKPAQGWGGYGENNRDSMQDVEAALAAGVVGGRARPGLRVPLAWFRTHEGRVIRLYLQEISFNAERPMGWPSPSEGRTAIVNSVDEQHSISGGVSRPILLGCDLTGLEGTSLSLGAVRSVPCSGSYGRLGISELRNVAIVTFAPDPRSRRSPCFDQDDANACLTRYLQLSLRGALEYRAPGAQQVEHIIVPELGTGTGGLSKDVFYDAIFGTLSAALAADDRRRAIPTNIYLQVWSGDVVGRYTDTEDAVRSRLTAIVEGWRAQAHPPESNQWLRMAGIAGSLAALMVAALLSPRIASRFPNVTALVAEPSLLRTVAWLVISFGLAEGVTKLLPVASTTQGLAELLVGLVIVPLSAPLASALGRVDADLKAERDKTTTASPSREANQPAT